MKNKQMGYINIPGSIFVLAPIGALLIVLEVIRIAFWIYEHVEVAFK